MFEAAPAFAIPVDHKVCCLDCGSRSTIGKTFARGRAYCPSCGSDNWYSINERIGISLYLRPEGVPLQ